MVQWYFPIYYSLLVTNKWLRLVWQQMSGRMSLPEVDVGQDGEGKLGRRVKGGEDSVVDEGRRQDVRDLGPML